MRSTGRAEGGLKHDIEARIRDLQKRLSDAETYEDWLAIAVQLDVLEGKEAWKKEPVGPDYDYESISTTMEHLRRLRETASPGSLAFFLRTCLYRSFGGTTNPRLHAHTRVGTKYLVEDYIAEVVRCLDHITDDERMPLERRFEFLQETRHHYGRTALLFSGGASLGMYHFGVVRALFEAGLLPRVLSGSSAGALVCAAIACKTDEELPGLFAPGVIRLDFFDTAPGSGWRKLWRLFSHGYLMDIDKLQECVAYNLGNITFQEAYDKTKRVLNITVSPTNKHQVPQLLNYLTAPNVVVWSAACASCALPGIFPPVSLLAKDEDGNLVPYHLSGMKWSDGSVEADLPMARLAEMFNVNYFLVSQVNPHVLPFVTAESESPGALARRLKLFVASELKHRFLQLAELDLLPRFLNGFVPLFTQRYQGDITIFPSVGMSDYQNIFVNPTTEMLQRAILDSQRKTWPKIGIIRNHCRVELALDRCWRRLCERAAAAGAPTAGSQRSRSAPPVPPEEGRRSRTESLRTRSQAGVASGSGSPLPHTPPSAISRVPSWVCMAREGEAEREGTPPNQPQRAAQPAPAAGPSSGAGPSSASSSSAPSSSPSPPLPTIVSSILAPVAQSPVLRPKAPPPSPSPARPAGFAVFSVPPPRAPGGGGGSGGPPSPRDWRLDGTRGPPDLALKPAAASSFAACKGKAPAEMPSAARRLTPRGARPPARRSRRNSWPPAEAGLAPAPPIGGHAPPRPGPAAVIELFDATGMAVAAALRGLALAGIPVVRAAAAAAAATAAPARPPPERPGAGVAGWSPGPWGGEEAGGESFSKHGAGGAADGALQGEIQRALDRAAGQSGLEAAAEARVRAAAAAACPARLLARNVDLTSLDDCVC